MKRRTWRWWTAEERASWPSGYKKCRTCFELWPVENYHKLRHAYMGISNDCMRCRQATSKSAYVRISNEYHILNRAKTRATEKNLDFNLELSDIKIPEYCPILGVKLVRKHHQNAPSIDRLDPTKGYIKGNINIISNRANMIKNAATVEELTLVLDWLRKKKDDCQL